MSKLVKFYGDGSKGRNYLYKFNVNSRDDAEKCIKRLIKCGVKNIRGVYYNGERIG